MKSDSFDSQLIHAGFNPDAEEGSMSVPIHMAASYRLPGFGIKLIDALQLSSEHAAHIYTRWSNPTLRLLEKRLSALEGAEAALTFASGMAAISAVMFHFLRSGSHIVASEICYSGAVELIGDILPRFGVEVSLVNTSDLEAVRLAMRPNTRLVYVETPANPVLRIADIQEIARIAHEGKALLAVDSTFASPALQKPLALGADLVIHSLTKYLNGHNDALGGVILGKETLIHELRQDMMVHLGGVLSPFNAWLILRGIETLAIRMERHSQNALEVARFLETHPSIERVYYPWLESHPHHELAKKQMLSGGGMLSFRLKTGLSGAINLAEKVRLFTYATSLGHPASLLFFYPYDMFIEPAAYYSKENKISIREWMGEGLVRASIGLEDPNELIADLDRALRARTFKGFIGSKLYQWMKPKGEK